jgi:hypothetical protein
VLAQRLRHLNFTMCPCHRDRILQIPLVNTNTTESSGTLTCGRDVVVNVPARSIASKPPSLASGWTVSISARSYSRAKRRAASSRRQDKFTRPTKRTNHCSRSYRFASSRYSMHTFKFERARGLSLAKKAQTCMDKDKYNDYQTH